MTEPTFKYRAIGRASEIGRIVFYLSQNGYDVLRLSYDADPFVEVAKFGEDAYEKLLKQDWFLKTSVDVFLNN